jgi:hypothetical protein
VKNRNRLLKTEALLKCETGPIKARSLAEIHNEALMAESSCAILLCALEQRFLLRAAIGRGVAQPG